MGTIGDRQLAAYAGTGSIGDRIRASLATSAFSGTLDDLGGVLGRLNPTPGFQDLAWSEEWTRSVGTNEGSGTGQQYRGVRVDGSGRVWTSGGLVTYNGAASAEEYLNSTALTLTAPTTTQRVNFIGVGHNRKVRCALAKAAE